MKNYLFKVAGVGLGMTMALAVSSSAQAYNFSFTLDDGTNSATGTIYDLSDGNGVAPSSIEVNSPNIGLVTFPGSGGTFDVAGGSIVASNYESFASNAPAILNLSPNPSTNIGGILAFNYNDASRTNIVDSDSNPQYSQATPVPFGVSTDLSILILGGLYGVSRLRKKLSAR